MKKILIVDDQMEVRELVDVTLRGVDLTILKASNGDEAVKLARKEIPDLIIMDLMMPGSIDGVEATRLLKKDEKTRRISIIILTAKGQEADIEKGYQAGADGYFIKPFSPLELIQKVEEILEA